MNRLRIVLSLTCFVGLLMSGSGCYWFGGTPRQVAENIAIITNIDNWDDHEKLRTASRKLKILDDTDSIEPLIDLLEHESPFVRGDAAGALITITGQPYYDNPDEWRAWWDVNQEEFIQRREIQEFEGEPDLKEGYAGVQRQYGEVALQSGLMQFAIAHFTNAVEAEANNPLNHINLGRALRLVGAYDQAEDSFNRATSLNAALVEPYLNLGICALEQNRIDKAMVYLDIAKRKDQQKLETAKRLNRQDPNNKSGVVQRNWEILWYLGMAHVERADPREQDFYKATKYFEEMIRILPKSLHTPKMYLQLSRAYYGDDKYLFAWKMIMGLEASFPGDTVHPDYRDKVKWILYTQMNYDFSDDGEEPPTRPQETFDLKGYNKILHGDASALSQFDP